MKPIRAVFFCSRILAVCAALILAGGFFAQVGSQTKSPSGENKKVEKASPENDVVIGHLQSRDKIVTISKGQKGTVYTVKSKDGKTLNADLSEKDFEAKYPTLYQQVKYGLAGNDATLRNTKAVPIAPSGAREVPLEAKPAK
jgi:hypothetical protein